MAAGCVDKSIERGDVRGKKVFGRMHAAFRMREEWTFEVNSQGACATRLRKLGDFIGKTVEGT